MPTIPNQVINLVTRSRPPTLEEQQAERTERLAQAEGRHATAEAQQGLKVALANLLGAARWYRDRRESQNHHEEAEAALRLENLDLDGGGLYAMAAAVFVATMWLAIGAIDAAFLAGVSHLMIGMVYVTPQGPPWWAVVIAVGAILLLEIGLATRIALANRASEGGNPEARLSARRWRQLGIVLAVVVPALGIATLLTALAATTLRLDETQGLLLALGFVALAAVCHASVIFGGESALRAFARLLYAPRRWWLRRQIRKDRLGVQAAQDAAQDAILEFEAALNGYREAHGEPPRHLLIQARDTELVNAAVGERVLAGPAEEAVRPEPVPTSGDRRPEDQAAAAPAAAGDSQTGGQAASGYASAPDEADGHQAETEYLRGVLGARQRDVDGEVGQ